MHVTKRSRFSVPWSIQPPPSLTEVDCGVFMEYERAEPLKWFARSPIGHAFHPPQASNITPNFRHHKQGRRSVPGGGSAAAGRWRRTVRQQGGGDSVVVPVAVEAWQMQPAWQLGGRAAAARRHWR